MRNSILILAIINLSYFLWAFLVYINNPSIDEKSNATNETMPGANLEILKDNNLESSIIEKNKPLLCVVIGPIFENTDGLVSEAIQKENLKPLEIVKEIVEDEDYLVFLEPEISREAASQRLKELHEKKIDSFIIPEGEMINGISLGVFDKKENAEKKNQEMVGLGYNSKIKENIVKRKEKWLLLSSEKTALEQVFTQETLKLLTDNSINLKTNHSECKRIE